MKVSLIAKSNARIKVIIAQYAIIAVLFLSGCGTTNYVSKFYDDYTAGVPKHMIDARVLPYSKITVVRGSSNLKSDHIEMLRKNYVLIGVSGFSGTNINLSDTMIVEHAKKVQADFALYSTGYLGSEQGTQPVLNYTPGQTSTTNSYGTVNANAYGSGGYAYGSANYMGSSTTNTMGTLSVSHVPATFHRYEYSVAFYRKGVSPILGAITENLSDELRKKYQRNTGVVITTIIYNTPAFMANLFEGDVVIAINDESINSVEEYSQALSRFAGQDCVVTTLRKDEKVSIRVKLNRKS